MGSTPEKDVPSFESPRKPERSPSREFLRRATFAGPAGLPDPRPFERKVVTPRKPAVPRHDETRLHASPSRAADPHDFVRENALEVIHHHLMPATPPRSARDLPDPLAKDDYGTVPAYLAERMAAAEAAEAERRRRLGEPGCPPGMRVMDRGERLELLSKLIAARDSASHDLLSLPLASDTPKMRGRRANLEGRIAEIEEAIAVFERDRVLVDVVEGRGPDDAPRERRRPTPTQRARGILAH